MKDYFAKKALKFAALFLLFVLFTAASTETQTNDNVLNYPGFQPVVESKAYLAYKKRPQSELSKLIYLIDRFVDVDGQVLYEGHYYPISMAARVARLYLITNYKNETVEYWIKHWVTTSYPSGERIYGKFSDGKSRLAGEVASEEYKLFEQILKADKSINPNPKT